RVLVGRLADFLSGRCLAQFIDIRFVRQAEGSDPHVLDPPSLGEEFVEHIPGLGIVDLASRPYQGGLLRCGRDDEPWIDGDAVSADARTRLQDVDARIDRKSTRLNSSHVSISYAVFCL